jgi:hypothetical protein
MLLQTITIMSSKIVVIRRRIRVGALAEFVTCGFVVDTEGS